MPQEPLLGQGPGLARPATRPSWANWIAGLGMAWALLLLTIAVVTDRTVENLTLFLAIPGSGIYTLLLFFTRPLWLGLLARRPLLNATLLGILNAAVVETLFLVIERLTGAEGVAAHPNLVIDLLMTMPWYTLMVITFVRVQHRRRFGPGTGLLLGALYEVGGDGIAGSLVGMLSGDFQILTPGYWLVMMGMFFWAFIPVYSSMVLPPAWLIATTAPPHPPTTPAWRDALKPLIWVIPFSIYVALWILGLYLVACGPTSALPPQATPPP